MTLPYPAAGSVVDSTDDYSLYQTSTIAALLAGIYDGDVTVRQLLAHGDFGLGTFNHLDGEMVVLDGICYHLHSDGSVSTATGTEKTPFAAVTHFHAKTRLAVATPTPLRELIALIDGSSGGENVPLAVRIDGTFLELRTRTVGKQHRPYPPLVDATAAQRIDTLTDTVGTIAGFRTPRFEEAIAVAGYHLHYVDDGRQHGGHVLDLTLTKGNVTLAPITELHLSLNDSPESRTAHLDLDTLAQQERAAEGTS